MADVAQDRAGHGLWVERLVHDARGDGAGGHAVKFRGFHVLGEDKAPGGVDVLDAVRAVAA